ncbi:hypothetical protein SAMN06296056_103322 [Priestia filamentosa]|jgi:hypothetical protein|nr:hypothetical protein SAMN06296056_103322 [Priestia filamentosa]
MLSMIIAGVVVAYGAVATYMLKGVKKAQKQIQ